MKKKELMKEIRTKFDIIDNLFDDPIEILFGDERDDFIMFLKQMKINTQNYGTRTNQNEITDSSSITEGEE